MPSITLPTLINRGLVLMSGTQRISKTKGCSRLRWKRGGGGSPYPRRNSGLLHVCTRGRQHKSTENGPIGGLQDHRYLSVTTKRHGDASGQSTEQAKGSSDAAVRTRPPLPPPPKNPFWGHHQPRQSLLCAPNSSPDSLHPPETAAQPLFQLTVPSSTTAAVQRNRIPWARARGLRKMERVGRGGAIKAQSG